MSKIVIYNKENFIKECEKAMNSLNIYDMVYLKLNLKKFTIIKTIIFQLTVILFQYYNELKNNINRFSKAPVWDNTTDYQDRLILREFRIIYKQKKAIKILNHFNGSVQFHIFVSLNSGIIFL